MRLTPEKATRLMAPLYHRGLPVGHAGPPTALGPIRPLPIAWIMINIARFAGGSFDGPKLRGIVLPGGRILSVEQSR